MTTALGLQLKQRIGSTPLLRLERVTAGLADVQVLAKAEWANPGGSVKDRAASNIVNEALKAGKLGAGKALLDSTSGNTGIAYAMLGAAYGIPITLCMPSNVSAERKRILNAYGATVIYTDPGEGSDGAIRKAQEIAAAEPEKYYYADQYSNDANWRAHYRNGTADEIWRADRWANHSLCSHSRHQWNFCGNLAQAERVEPADPLHFATARLALSRHRGNQTYGDLDHSQDLRCRNRGRRVGHRNRSGLLDGQATGAGRGLAGGRFRGSGAGWCVANCKRSDCRISCRHHLSRLRRQVFE